MYYCVEQKSEGFFLFQRSYTYTGVIQRGNFKILQAITCLFYPCVVMYEIYCMYPSWAFTCPWGNTYSQVTKNALFSIFKMKFYLTLLSLAFAYPVFLILCGLITFILWDFRFSRQSMWRGVWRHVISLSATVSEEPSAVIFRMEGFILSTRLRDQIPLNLYNCVPNYAASERGIPNNISLRGQIFKFHIIQFRLPYFILLWPLNLISVYRVFYKTVGRWNVIE